MATLSDLADSAIEREWATHPRWVDTTRPYEAADVIRLRGSIRVEHSLARRGAEHLWRLLRNEPYVGSLSVMTGGQAVEVVRAGVGAIHISGREAATEASLLRDHAYPSPNRGAAAWVPTVVRRINTTLRHADRIDWAEAFADGDHAARRNWLVPVIADAGPDCGGAMSAYELTHQMIEAGAAAVNFDDRRPTEEHLGNGADTFLISTGEQIRKLVSARLAADVAGVPTVIIARTHSLDAPLLASDSDDAERGLTSARRTPGGLARVRPGIDAAVARGIAYCPHADLIWCETATPNLDEARVFAERIKAEYPDKLLAYTCSPSLNWRKHLDSGAIARFQDELGAMGYALQFVTLSGWHTLHESAFRLARGFVNHGLAGYMELHEREIPLEPQGYSLTPHELEAEADYSEDILRTISHPWPAAQRLSHPERPLSI